MGRLLAPVLALTAVNVLLVATAASGDGVSAPPPSTVLPVEQPRATEKRDEGPAAPSTPTARWLPRDDRCDVHRGRRFCDGPRRAPVPWGADADRAARLGLGAPTVAAKLLRSRPTTEWAKAANFVPITDLEWPVSGGTFGRGPSAHHDGVDVHADTGAEVRCVATGLVAYADNGVRGYGNLLVVLHAEGRVSVYAHLSEIRVFPGQLLRRGQVVGLVGNTGISRGSHLHFEWHDDGDPVDPMSLFAGRP